MCGPNKCVSANQRNCLKKNILLQLTVELDQSRMVYQLPMINQTLCIECKCWRIHAMADLYLRFKLRVEVGDNEIQTCVYALVITNRK